MTTPGCSYAARSSTPISCSGPPYELDTSVAPSATASSTPVARLEKYSLSASTSRILNSWHTARTVSTSREISCDQPLLSFVGSAFVLSLPSWLTFLKQPFALLHSPSPY